MLNDDNDPNRLLVAMELDVLGSGSPRELGVSKGIGGRISILTNPDLEML